METKSFNLNSSFSNFVKLGTISLAKHFLNCVYIGRSQTVAATAYGFSKQKIFKIFYLLTQEKAIQRCSEKQVLKLFVLLFLLPYTCILWVRIYTFIFTGLFLKGWVKFSSH